MYIFIAFTYFCHFLLCSEGSVRIIGGTEVPAGFGKYHVSLQNSAGYHVCGGAIISHRHLATAAHCIFGADAKHIKVIAATTDLKIEGLKYNVKSITMHENYNASLKINDVAVLEINGLFDLDNVEILQLDDGELKENDIILLTGFGAQEAHGQSSSRMHALNVTVFSQTTCQFAMRYTREVFESMFCTFTTIGQGSCHGDSGGPLIRKNKLVGLVSWGIPCGVGFPDVHTRISSHFIWIRNVIDRHVCSYCRPRSFETLLNNKVYHKTV